MSLLCGYWGKPDQARLSQLAQSLAHRKTQAVELVCFQDRLQIAFAKDDYSTSLAGVVRNGDYLIALAGMPQHASCDSIDSLFQKFQQAGIDVLQQLNGAFVGILDSPTGRYLFRDKSGRRTFYRAELNGDTYFSIESRAIYSLSDFNPELLPSSLAQYLSFSFVPGENTMLRGIHELPAGSYYCCDSKTTSRYFLPEALTPQPEKSEADWITQFNDVFNQGLNELVTDRNQQHVFLSGGIDSSLVTSALVEQHGAGSIQAHAIHFGNNYANELDYVREVSAYCNIQCEEVEINPKNLVPHLHEMVTALNDPIGDPVTMPNYLLAKHVAGQGVTSVFNGEGGDPIFGGPKNMAMLLHHWYGVERGENHREKAYLKTYRRSYEELKYLLTDDFKSQIDETEHLERVLTPFFEQSDPESFLKKLLLINMRLKGAHLILPKVERMLGAHGITPLSPLFDDRLIELVMSLPNDLILKNGVEKIILKEAFRGRLPDSIIHRPKWGMRVPVHYWFKGEMKRYVRKVLSRKRIRNAGIFDYKRVKQLLDYNIEQGPGRYGMRLWMLLTFEIWREQIFGE